MIMLRAKYLIFGALRVISYILMETLRDIGEYFELREEIIEMEGRQS